MARFSRFKPFQLTDANVTDKELGRGSYATVLEVEYMGLKCAGKKVHNALLQQGDDSYTLRRFEEECRLLSRIHHPNIVQFLGVHFQQGIQAPILVMEFLPYTLTFCIQKYGIFPKEISYSILHDVALGLCYLHHQSPPIIHRDLSSNNVLLTPNMTAKISDLGVARILNLAQLMTQTPGPGTPVYMPPEVMTGEPKYYGTGVDEFSYGILMIHIFSGRWPEPQIGPISTGADGTLTLVTEVKRREVFLHEIGYDHPLMSFMQRCIDNDPECRVPAREIVTKMVEMLSQFSTSFPNRLEMLRRIQASREAESDKREAQDKAIELNFAIGNEVEHLKLQLRNLKSENLLLQAKNESDTAELLSKCAVYEAQVQGNDKKLHTLTNELVAKTTVLQEKDDIIVGLNNQLTRARECLSLKQQVLQVSITWKHCADIPHAVGECSTTIIDDKVYCGGDDGGTAGDGYIVYCYDPPQDKWTSLPPVSVKRFGLGQVNGRLVAIGGVKNDCKITNEVHAFDARSKKWKHAFPAMPTARDFPGVLSLQSALIVAGGNLIVSDDYRYSDAVEIFKPDTSQWYRVDPLPTACLDISLVVSGNTCYAIGGYADSQLDQVLYTSVDDLLSTDHSSKIWKSLESTPTYQPSAATLAGNLLAIGGREKSKGGVNKKEVYMYSSCTNSWIYISDLPAPLHYSAVAEVSSMEILVVGGLCLGKGVSSLYKGTLCLKP